MRYAMVLKLIYVKMNSQQMCSSWVRFYQDCALLPLVAHAWGLTGVEKLLAIVVAYVDRRLTPRLTYPLLECRRIENLCLVEARFNQVHGYLEVA